MVSSDTAISDTKLFELDPQVLLGGRYQIIKQLAEGTFGHTYLARDWHLPDHPICVIKQLKPQSNGEEMKTARRLFDSEARALYALGSHGQIPHLLAHFEESDEFFLVQEYIKGRSLCNEIVTGTPWNESRVIALVEEILEVLSFVHHQQVIHRDIKPANLIRRYSDGKIVLIDFGAVKLASTAFSHPEPGETELTIAIGTAGYIPKEQVGGRPRYSSDVYSTGIVGLQALTGISPQQFAEDRWSGELEWHGLAPHVSPEFAQVLDRMTRYDFRDRYADAAAALSDLRQLPMHLRQSPPPLPGLAEPSMLPLNGAPLPPTVVHGDHPPLSSPPSAQSTGAIAANQAAATVINLNQRSSPPTPPVVLPTVASKAGQLQSGPHQPAAQSPKFRQLTGNPLQRPAVPGPSRRAASPLSEAGKKRSYRPNLSALSTERFTGQWLHELATLARWQLSHWRQKRLHLWYLTAVAGLISGFAALPLVARQPLSGAASNIDTDDLLASAELLIQQVPIGESLNSNASLRLGQLISEAIKLERDGRSAEALDAYSTALTIDSTNLEALWGRCKMLNALDQGEMALEACNDLLAVSASDPVGLWGIAEANSTMQLYDKALDLFNQALDQHPEFAPLWKGRAELLWSLGDDDAAIASLERALAVQPDYKEALALRQAWLGF